MLAGAPGDSDWWTAVVPTSGKQAISESEYFTASCDVQVV
jgi:hypothetical protein